MINDDRFEEGKVVIAYCDVLVSITCVSKEESDLLKENLKLNSYEFDISENEKRKYNYTIILNDKKELNQNEFASNKLKNKIQIHQETMVNEEDYEMYGTYYDESGKRYIYNPKENVYIIFIKNTSTLYIYGDMSSRIEVVIDVLREQLIQKGNEYHGYYYLKGAAFTINSDNDVCAIVGGTKSGKTTTLLSILNCNDSCKFVTNSASYLNYDINIDNVMLHSWRPYMRIRLGTAMKYDIFTDFIHQLKENVGIYSEVDLQKDLIKIPTYEEFKKYFNKEYLKSGILKKILFVNIVEDINECFLLKKQNDIKLINENFRKFIRMGRDPAHPNYLNIDGECIDIIKETYNQFLEKLLNKVDIYSLKINQAKISELDDVIKEIFNRIN